MRTRPKACPVCQSHKVQPHIRKKNSLRDLIQKGTITLGNSEEEYDNWVCEECNHTWRYRHTKMQKKRRLKSIFECQICEKSCDEETLSFNLDTHQSLKFFEWSRSLIRIYEGAIGGALSFICTIQEDGKHFYAQYERPSLYGAIGLFSESIDLTEFSCKKVIRQISDMISNDDKSAKLFIQRGIFKRLDQDLTAIEDFKTALKYDPKDSEAHLQLGISYHSMREYDQARNAYTHAISHNPQCAIAFLYRGLLSLHANNVEECEKDWECAFAIDHDVKNILQHPVAEYMLEDQYLLHYPIIHRHTPRYTYLSDDEYLKFRNWMKNNNLTLKLANGQYFEFKFRNTGVGKIITATFMPLGISIDLTDYDNW